MKEYVVLPKLQEAENYDGTSDMWTNAGCQPYMSFTVHLIDRGWNLQSCCPDTVSVIADHTGHNMDVLANWELPLAELVATTTDNGSNFCISIKILEQLRISCLGHNLELAVRKGLRNELVRSVFGQM